MTDQRIFKGLDGIYVGETAISDVDGINGNLIYRGRSIDELVAHDFVEVAHLLVFGSFPTAEEKFSLETFLNAHSKLEDQELAILNNLPKELHPMQMLQSMILLLNFEDRITHDYDKEVAEGLIICAKIPSLIAAWYQISQGGQIDQNVDGLSMLQRFLYQFNGELPKNDAVKVLETCQILQLEHSYNASTFAGLVTASTLASVPASISAAIGTLSGKLHGGADQAALEMALEIKHVDLVSEYLANKLSNKEKIMGLGHREYKVVDPRAKILKPMAKDLCENTPFEMIFSVLEKVEEIMVEKMQDRGLDVRANVEFYKGPVFYALGIPSQYFTALFAMSRSFGYLAHILESRKDNRLIRPKALYVGKAYHDENALHQTS